MWRPWKQVSMARTRARSLRKSIAPISGPRAQFVDERVELLGAHEAALPLVVHEQHRRVAAGALAFAFLQREQAVGRGLVVADAQLLLEVLPGLGAVAQRAGQAGADGDLELADLLLVEHVVEGRDLLDRDRLDA